MTPSSPYVRSRVNGIMIPLMPGQVGIMHRFTNPENQVVIDQVNAAGGSTTSERNATLVVPSTPDPASQAAPEAAPEAAPAKRGRKNTPPPVNTGDVVL